MQVRSGRHRPVVAALLAGVLAVSALAGCGGGKSSAGASGPLSLYSDNPTWKDGFLSAGDALAKLTGHGLSPQSLPSTAN